MKKLLAALLWLPIAASGQLFSEKTNSISLDNTRPMVVSTLPSIVWTTPGAESSVSAEPAITIDVKVESAVEIQSIRLITKSGADVREKYIKLGDKDFNKRVQQKITLMDGENTIRLEVTNGRGAIVSSTRTILVGKDAIADAVDANRKDYALLIATDKYDNWDDLSNPVNDAHTVANILKDKYGFITEVVENVTLEELNDKLFDYNTRKFNPQDQLFIFFAGHGYFDETLGEGYVVAANSLLNDKGKTSYLSHTILRERLDNIKCDHIFLAMDVCFGGTFDKKLAKARGTEAMDEAIDKQYVVKKLSKRTRKFLTSGSKEYVPDGAPGHNSPFATQFIRALREIGGGTGRVMTLMELNTYFLRLPTEPYYGSFGADDPQSDFVFVAK
ncbi:MAG: caspase family protein [Cyclobacteriaceae bacterium]|nr:caspase family protein [Cyclobacteriaceae bacterium]